MNPSREEEKNRPDGAEWSGWSEGFKTDGQSRRILGIGRGKARLYALAGANDDPKAGEAVVKTCADCYLRRPGVKPLAMRMIGQFMNETAAARMKPSHDYRFDAALFYLFGDNAAWTISGKASILVFVDGQIFMRSADKVYSSLGLSINFNAETQAAFALPQHFKDKIALFLCSDALPGELDLDLVAKALAEAKKPADWLEGVAPMLMELSGQEEEEYPREKSAMAVFLPQRKRIGGFR